MNEKGKRILLEIVMIKSGFDLNGFKVADIDSVSISATLFYFGGPLCFLLRGRGFWSNSSAENLLWFRNTGKVE